VSSTESELQNADLREEPRYVGYARRARGGGGQVRKARFPLENRDQMLRFAGPQDGGSKDSATAEAQPQSVGGQ
jgi:hypothetical protein